jgi:hypothetical protein
MDLTAEEGFPWYSNIRAIRQYLTNTTPVDRVALRKIAARGKFDFYFDKRHHSGIYLKCVDKKASDGNP